MAEPAKSCNRTLNRPLTRCFASILSFVKKASILHVMLFECLGIEAAPTRDQEAVVPRILTWMVSLALPLGAAVAGSAPALAASVDGNWSVLVITEKGTCDRGYRYSVNISNGHVRYTGETSVNMSGTVAPSGAVKVSIKFGDQSAGGTGRLSATSGAGTWRGVGSSGTCSGRWEAERR